MGGPVDPDFPHALPAASVDTREEGIELRSLLCRKGYGPRQWIFNDFQEETWGLEALYTAGEKIEKHYQQLKQRKENHEQFTQTDRHSDANPQR